MRSLPQNLFPAPPSHEGNEKTEEEGKKPFCWGFFTYLLSLIHLTVLNISLDAAPGNILGNSHHPFQYSRTF